MVIRALAPIKRGTNKNTYVRLVASKSVLCASSDLCLDKLLMEREEW